MRYSSKAPIAVAVAAAISTSGAFANDSISVTSPMGMTGDGYAYSGQTARSQALQLNYFTHDDQGNIWVNPALASHYGDRVMINVNNNNNDGEGSGGILFGSDTHTFGIYIGRDSASQYGDQLDPAVINDEFEGVDTDEYDPESQFDLFYAMDLGDVNVGARLNYQNNEQSQSQDPTAESILFDLADGIGGDVDGNLVPTEFTDLDSALSRLRDNVRADSIDEPADEELVFSGQAFIGQGRNGADLEADEINLSLGFEVESLNLDGALLLGQASGTHSASDSFTDRDFELAIDEDDEQETRVTNEREGFTDEELELDDGSTMGISLRYTVFEREESSLRLSGSFVSQDYTADYSYLESTTDTQFNEDEERLGVTETTERWAGEQISETDQFTLMASYELRPVQETQITVASGIVMTETDTGSNFERLESLEREEAFEDGYQGLEEGQVRNNFPNDVGPDSRFDREREMFEVPLIIAAEHSVNERWTARGSISRNLYRDVETSEDDLLFEQGGEIGNNRDATDSDDQSDREGPNRNVLADRETMSMDETWIEQPTQVRLGMGYQRGQFGVDTLIGKEFFTQGTDETLFAAASFTYDF